MYSCVHFKIILNNVANLNGMTAHLFPVFLIFNWIHSTARLCIKHEVKAGIFAESTSIAQEGVFFVIVDGPYERNPN